VQATRIAAPRSGDGLFKHPTIKAVLFLGFGLTLGLWLFAGYQFTAQMAEVEREAAAVNARYTHAQDLLATVRAQILLGSVYVRDALLSGDPADMEDNRRHIGDTYRAINAALDQYEPVLELPPGERDRIATLRREIDGYRIVTDDVLSIDSSERPRAARRLLNERIVPKRGLVVGLSEEVQALNRMAFVRQQDNIAAIYRATQLQVWRQVGLALAASLGIAFFATMYAAGLERRIRLHAATETESRGELQRLSARLLSAHEDERRTIARELHDEIGQALAAIKVELAVAQSPPATAGAPPHSLEIARSIADGVLQSVRDLSHLLHPSLLDDLGLGAAVERYARDFERRHAMPVEVLSEGIHRRLAPETETAAYRIVQEALTNVARHSHATRCTVRLVPQGEALLVAVEDNGIGFDPDVRRRDGGSGGLGLIGIRERALELGGTIHLDSATGRGTRLTVLLPARKGPDDIAVSGGAETASGKGSDPWVG
jgi:signal transduction histidine kinase